MRPKIAICFFGITRSLKYTISSIKENIICPAELLGDVEVYSHFFQQANISNPRTGEVGALDLREYQLLESDRIELENPDECLALYDFEYIKSFGDRWHDDYRSLSNILHQLHSLRKVTEAALLSNADLYVFARPDLTYHDTLLDRLAVSIKSSSAKIYLPSWQHWGGYNDRFSICRTPLAAEAYGLRINVIPSYLEDKRDPMHSESLLKYALDTSGIEVKLMPCRASRTRFDGTIHKEQFHHRRIASALRTLAKIKRSLRTGTHSTS